MAAPSSTPTAAPTTTPRPTFLQRPRTRVLDFIFPDVLRREYRKIIASLAKYRYAGTALATSILFDIAEYEQPGYLPRPQELTAALIGFLCASALVFGAFALMEYTDSHTWPWQDEGFVWPWEMLLWSGTAYVDEPMADSVAAYRNLSLSSSSSIRVDGGGDAVEQRDTAVRNSGTSTMADIPRGSTTPVGSPARPDIIIPPTPLLPGGLRPFHLPPPLEHHSGLLGDSPRPIKFKHFSGHSDLEDVNEE